MAGGRKRMQKAVARTVQESERVSITSEDENAGPDLSTDVLEFIFSKLNLRDNIRAASVCRRWLAVAISLREPNNSPWLMSFPKSGDWYQFYDPSTRGMFFGKFPELSASRIFYAKDSWLLALKPLSRCVFFFHPCTRHLIKLPKMERAMENLAFSAAPTSQDCVVFTIKNVAPDRVEIATCRPGADEWTTENFHSPLHFTSSIWNKVVFTKGLFYCLSLDGRLGVFEPVGREWMVTFIRPPRCTEFQSVEHWRRGRFMAVDGEDVFVVYTSGDSAPLVYKLKETEGVWEEIGCSEGVTIFANSLTSVAKRGFHGSMRDTVYFSKVIFHGRRCVRYSLLSGRYYPRKQLYDWGSEDAFQSVWIDRPQDISVLLPG